MANALEAGLRRKKSRDPNEAIAKARDKIRRRGIEPGINPYVGKGSELLRTQAQKDYLATQAQDYLASSGSNPIESSYPAALSSQGSGMSAPDVPGGNALARPSGLRGMPGPGGAGPSPSDFRGMPGPGGAGPSPSDFRGMPGPGGAGPSPSDFRGMPGPGGAGPSPGNSVPGDPAGLLGAIGQGQSLQMLAGVPGGAMGAARYGGAGDYLSSVEASPYNQAYAGMYQPQGVPWQVPGALPWRR